MKRILILCFILGLAAGADLDATLTRVRSLGDTEDPVTGRLSGLIRDDIADISFNPARVNDVKATLILLGGNLHYGYADDAGAPGDEQWNYYKIIEGVTTNQSKVGIDRKGYEFDFSAGVLLPMNFFNLYVQYTPAWSRNREDYSFDSNVASSTDALIRTRGDSYTEARLPFDVTVGFNIRDLLLLGIRAGYFHERQDQYYCDEKGLVSKKGEYSEEIFLLGAGIKFNFTKRIALSLAADFTVSQKDDSPLRIEPGFSGAGSYNYDSVQYLYQYLTAEKEAGYNFRLIPEIALSSAGSAFIRIILEATLLDYEKEYNFNLQGGLANYEITDFTKNRYLAGVGASFSHEISSSAGAVYGLKYSGLLKGLNQYKFFEDRTDQTRYREYKELDYDHFLKVFLGFDISLTRYFMLRAGLSQGLYRKTLVYRFDRSVVSGSENVSETDLFQEEFLPGTVFALGFAVRPLARLLVEFNFTGMKDWNMENLSRSEEIKKTDGREKERTEKKNYDFDLGLSVSVRI